MDNINWHLYDSGVQNEAHTADHGQNEVVPRQMFTPQCRNISFICIGCFQSRPPTRSTESVFDQFAPGDESDGNKQKMNRSYCCGNSIHYMTHVCKCFAN